MKKILHLLAGVLVAALFIWLSLRDADLSELARQLGGIRYGWLLPFLSIVLLGNYLRAERWKMVLDDESGLSHSRLQLFTGLMYGLTANVVVPRAGEFLRALYVSRHTGMETSRLFGTIVLERVLDMLMMLIMLLVTVILLITDSRLLEQVFGREGAAYIGLLTSATGLTVIGLTILTGFGLLWYLRVRADKNPDKKTEAADESKITSLIKGFLRGVVAVRNLKNWPLFVVYTILIWLGYVAMSLLPFYAFDFHITYDFGWIQAFVITVVGAVGVTLPSPGGIGTYHYLVQQGLFYLYGVPMMTALGYATVNHLANLFGILLIAAGLFVVNQRLIVGKPGTKIPFSELFR